MIPRNFKFNFSTISQPIQDYQRKIEIFYSLRQREKDTYTEPMKTAKPTCTWILMKNTLKNLISHFHTLITYFTSLEAKFVEQGYPQFSLVYGATAKQSANHSIFTIGGERLDKVRNICQNFEDFINKTKDRPKMTLKQVQDRLGKSKEYLDYQTLMERNQDPKYIPKYIQEYLPHRQKEMQECIGFDGPFQKGKWEFKLDLTKLADLLNENLDIISSCLLINKLTSIFRKKDWDAQSHNFINQKLVGKIQKIRAESQIQEQGQMSKLSESGRVDFKSENSEQIKEERSELSYNELLKKDRDLVGKLKQQDRSFVKSLFDEIAKSMILSAFESEEKFYKEYRQVIDLIGCLVDLDVEELERDTKISILKDVQSILQMLPEERGLLLKKLRGINHRKRPIRISKMQIRIGTKIGQRNKPVASLSQEQQQDDDEQWEPSYIRKSIKKMKSSR